jgi:N-acyl-D-amino-acid deacylase
MLACGFSQEPATADQMRHQLDLVETGMKQGALGMSAGLTYVPAMYASDDEITELNKVVAKYDGFYSPHHRNYGANFLDAVADCISIASKSGCKLHLTLVI